MSRSSTPAHPCLPAGVAGVAGGLPSSAALAGGERDHRSLRRPLRPGDRGRGDEGFSPGAVGPPTAQGAAGRARTAAQEAPRRAGGRHGLGSRRGSLGGQPGRPISTTRLTQRLNNLGIRPNQARSTALFQLATEIPAAILARTLGIHTDVAVAWQRLSAGDWANYAAEVSARSSAPGRPTPPNTRTSP
jgi:hypothetical protein